MADSFNLIRTPKLVFGPGKLSGLPSLIAGRGSNVLVITGANSYKHNPPVQELFTRLERNNLHVHIENLANEPTPDDIDRITNRFGAGEIDLVISIGGGSVIDAGKAVSAMLKQRGNVKDYLEGVGTKSPSGEKLFFVAVPTTSGTGSESTSNAVITQIGANGFKRSLRHENFVPDLAIVDPVLTLGCPPGITAASGMDAFTQLLESYLSTKASPFTDALALDGIWHIKNSIENAVFRGDDIQARSGMAYAAFLSGITLSNAGLGLVHGFASAVGGYYQVPHGTVCGTMMGTVNRWNVNELLTISVPTVAHEKYTHVGKLLSGNSEKNPDWYMKFAAGYFEQLTEILGIKKLSEFGVDEQSIEKIIAVTDHKANPVKFNNEALSEMIRSRL